jgi:hypothetical protein
VILANVHEKISPDVLPIQISVKVLHNTVSLPCVMLVKGQFLFYQTCSHIAVNSPFATEFGNKL